MREFYAHTRDGRPAEDWQKLSDHLQQVASIAGQLADKFKAGVWGACAGKRHDLGKYSNAYQEYLLKVTDADPHTADGLPKTDHSTAGAKFSVESDNILGYLLAYVIAGHHSGLLDGRAEGACLESRLTKIIEPWQENAEVEPESGKLTLPDYLVRAFSVKDRDPFATSFFTRMIFSCLTDADFLDTESFMDQARAAGRPVWPKDILQRMEDALNAHIGSLKSEDTPVNKERAAVRAASISAAAKRPGLFSLTVPTGGGKTLSSLAFGLRHAILHGLDRVIYVIPFTSIIEQNAGVFRRAMAPLLREGLPDPVLEHHCSVDEGNETTISRLAVQNWDSPLVVTTSVQFYDSLFSNRTSKCRKLHNMARSVIILDEAQALPVDFLEPCLRAVELLSRDYGSSVVLCTATQPAINRRENFQIGLEGIREIVPEPAAVYTSLKRVDVESIGTVEDDDLAGRLLDEDQVLCIVNTRGHARRLYELLGPQSETFHLSAQMCPEHRSAALTEIRKRLDARLPCRVVSTQLIEAGVDIDFPVVFRSMAGLDSIAQAAGRCNRNGLLKKKGRTYVFKSEHVKAERFFSDTANSASEVLPLYADPLSLDAIEHYFRLYYWDQSSRWDAKHIIGAFRMDNDPRFPFSFSFAEVADLFHLVDDTGRTVIVPWGEKGRRLCEELRHAPAPASRPLLRQLQRFTVQINSRLWSRHLNTDIQLVHERYPVLVSPELHYDEATGLFLEDTDGKAFVC